MGEGLKHRVFLQSLRWHCPGVWQTPWVGVRPGFNNPVPKFPAVLFHLPGPNAFRANAFGANAFEEEYRRNLQWASIVVLKLDPLNDVRSRWNDSSPGISRHSCCG